MQTGIFAGLNIHDAKEIILGVVESQNWNDPVKKKYHQVIELDGAKENLSFDADIVIDILDSGFPHELAATKSKLRDVLKVIVCFSANEKELFAACNKLSFTTKSSPLLLITKPSQSSGGSLFIDIDKIEKQCQFVLSSYHKSRQDLYVTTMLLGIISVLGGCALGAAFFDF